MICIKFWLLYDLYELYKMMADVINNKANNDYLMIFEICLFVNSIALFVYKPLLERSRNSHRYTITKNNLFSKHSKC